MTAIDRERFDRVADLAVRAAEAGNERLCALLMMVMEDLLFPMTALGSEGVA